MTENQISVFLVIMERYLYYLEKGLRKGQSIFNASHDIFYEEAEQLSCTEFDCFYDDSKVGDFLSELFYIIEENNK